MIWKTNFLKFAFFHVSKFFKDRNFMEDATSQGIGIRIHVYTRTYIRSLSRRVLQCSFVWYDPLAETTIHPADACPCFSPKDLQPFDKFSFRA